jgi:hypothetical protein
MGSKFLPFGVSEIIRATKLGAMTEHHHEQDFEQGVMVDVGPGAGALVIYARDELRGQEIEISPAGKDTQRVHTDVLRRRMGGGYVCAAVFGSLVEGAYRLWHESLPTPREVHIVGGEVTELDWR